MVITLETPDSEKLSWVDPQPCLPEVEGDPDAPVLTDEQITQWREEGFCLVDGVYPEEVWQAAKKELMDAHPPPKSKDDAQNISETQNFGSKKFNFPANGDTPLNNIPIHPRVIKCVEQLFGDKNTDDIRLIQTEGWQKVGAAAIKDPTYANQDQRMHCDFGNNTLAHPTDWYTPEVVAGILYYSSVENTLGATALVPREGKDDWAYKFDEITYNCGHRGFHYCNNRTSSEAMFEKNHPEVHKWRTGLYPREKYVNYKPGTLLLYRQDVWHRGTPLLPGAVRYAHNLAWKKAHAEWVTCWHDGFARKMYADSALLVEKWFAALTPSQRSLLGFPYPGHKYWTPTTLRYNKNRWVAWGMDFAEYEKKMIEK